LASTFASVEKRRELLYILLRRGFDTRMHSYEYFVRKGNFVAIVVLSPNWNLARIKLIGWNLRASMEAAREIGDMLRELDPRMRIEVA
jgi:hypothetical protein